MFIIVYLLIYMVHYSSESADGSIINLKMTSEAECHSMKREDMDSKTVYKIQMDLLNSTCSTNPEQQGFYCNITFNQKDEFAVVEAQLCVDLQGVPHTMPDTQLTLTVFNSRGKLKDVYETSLIPEDASYYVCSGESSRSLSLSLSVRDSVKMCPYIMSQLVGNSISFGSVMMRPTLPTYSVSVGDCLSPVTTRDNAYVVKVTPEGSSSHCTFQNLKNHSYTNTNSCIELIYVSIDYNCNISVKLLHYSQSFIQFEVPSGRPFPLKGKQQFCTTYSNAHNDDEVDSILVIQKNVRTDCTGSFAIRATFTETDNDVPESADVDKMTTLYMAVFISLISVCLLILCITCILCLHMRSKRRQQAQRQSIHGGPNEGFEAPHTQDTNVSWNPNNIDDVHGLPSYDEICAKDTNANHLSTEEEPPPYDTLFASDV